MARRGYRGAPLGLGLMMAACICAGEAGAQDRSRPFDRPRIDLSLTASLVSDYRFRGVSQSGRAPAAQGTVTVAHSSGPYAYGWISSIADNGGAGIETTLASGYITTLGPWGIDASAAYYAYPGARENDYAELAFRVQRKIGAAVLMATFAYAPAQANIGGTGNVYIAMEGSLPIEGTPLAIRGAAGWENGAFAADKRDWSVGIGGNLEGFDCALSYVDTAGAQAIPDAEAAIVMTVSKTF